MIRTKIIIEVNYTQTNKQNKIKQQQDCLAGKLSSCF